MYKYSKYDRQVSLDNSYPAEFVLDNLNFCQNGKQTDCTYSIYR